MAVAHFWKLNRVRVREKTGSCVNAGGAISAPGCGSNEHDAATVRAQRPRHSGPARGKAWVLCAQQREWGDRHDRENLGCKVRSQKGQRSDNCFKDPGFSGFWLGTDPVLYRMQTGKNLVTLCDWQGL